MSVPYTVLREECFFFFFLFLSKLLAKINAFLEAECKEDFASEFLLPTLFIFSDQFLGLMTLLCVSFHTHMRVWKVPSPGPGVVSAGSEEPQSGGNDCPLQPSPQSVSPNAVVFVSSIIFLLPVLNVSHFFSQLFSGERSNAIFVAVHIYYFCKTNLSFIFQNGILIPCIRIICAENI